MLNPDKSEEKWNSQDWKFLKSYPRDWFIPRITHVQFQSFLLPMTLAPPLLVITKMQTAW